MVEKVDEAYVLWPWYHTSTSNWHGLAGINDGMSRQWPASRDGNLFTQSRSPLLQVEGGSVANGQSFLSNRRRLRTT